MGVQDFGCTTHLAAAIRFSRLGMGGDLLTARHTAAHFMEQFTERRVLLGRRRQVLAERVMDQGVAQAWALGTVQAVLATRHLSVVLFAHRLIRRPKVRREALVPRAV